MAEVVEQVGAPDILVNNAAVTFLRPLDEFPEKRARLDVRDARARAAAPHAAGAARDARAQAGVGAHDDLGRGRPDRRAAVLRVRHDRRLRHVRHGEGGDEPTDAEPRRRALRRRHRGQRGGAVGSGARRQGPARWTWPRRTPRTSASSPRPRSSSAPAIPPRSPAGSSTPSRSCARWAGSRPDDTARELPSRIGQYA